MDITDFINSRDIREYHRKIGYEYDSLEAAWIVYQCHSKTLEEKHAAWRWIINNMPDREPTNCGSWHDLEDVSVHKLISDYIEMDNSFIDEFTSGDGGFLYSYRRFGRSRDFGVDDTDGFFSSWRNCLRYIVCLEDEEDTNYLEIRRCLPDEGLGRLYSHGNIVVDLGGRIMSVTPAFTMEENERWYYLRTFFEKLWFNFPVPFKCGDIVVVLNRFHSEDLEPIVLKGIVIPPGRNDKAYTFLRRGDGDNTDMNIWGYAADVEWSNFYNGVYSEVWWNYMDVEYYRKELTGPNRVLKPISNWIKGELGDDLCLLLAGYHHILTEEHLARTIPKMYSDEGLKLAGITSPKRNAANKEENEDGDYS